MKLTLSKEISLPTGVLGLAMQADGARLFAACLDGCIYDVVPSTGTVTAFGDKHTSYASGCVALPDGKTIISAGYDGQLLWHDVAKRSCFRRVQAHDFWSWQMALSPDGTRVASVSGQYLAGGEKYEPAPASQPTVKIYDTFSGEQTHAFDHLPPVLSTAFSPNGQYLAAANMMGEVRVWELATSTCVSTFTTPDFTSWGIIKSPHFCGGIYGLSFAPDGNSLLLCGMGPMTDPMAGNGVQTWQRWSWRDKPEKLNAIRDGEHGTGLQETLAHTVDGNSFLMAGRQAQGTWNAALFNVADGKLITSLDTKSRITRAHFTPEGKHLFLAASGGQPGRDKEGVWKPFGKIHVVDCA